ncbi:MAG: rhodanese-like domain-containing protein [Actinomycetota bacterium]
MSVPTETPQGLAARRGDVQILDVREPAEWAAGHVEGSVHLELNHLLAGADPGLDPARPTVVVCRSGARSELGTLLLVGRGHDAANLVGGLAAWAGAGLPLVADDGTAGRVL